LHISAGHQVSRVPLQEHRKISLEDIATSATHMMCTRCDVNITKLLTRDAGNIWHRTFSLNDCHATDHQKCIVFESSQHKSPTSLYHPVGTECIQSSPTVLYDCFNIHHDCQLFLHIVQSAEVHHRDPCIGARAWKM